VRLAEQNKTLTEENPSKRVRLKFDRENPTRNRGCETRLKDKLCFFMILNSKQSKCKKSRSLRGGTPSPRKALSSCLLLVFASTAFYSPQSSVLAAGIPSVQLLSQAPESNINILYVSSNGGSDTGGNGSDQSPFKTLTYALSVAPPKTAILLAPGTYSAQSGEKFPLMLRPSVTVQGNPSTRGQNIVIKGGGEFLSPTSAGQNIAILGADGAGLSGVTVTNTNYRGYALWIESSSPTVVNNTFSGSTHDGISVVGTGRPTIGGNFFSKNGANGITIFGDSRPEVRDNVFEDTGFGVNVAQNASPLLIGNKITRNKDGVVVQADARPVLRNNYIESNRRDGIVAISRALPDLGTSAEPGGNVIRNNGQYDVNNAAKGQVIPAYGNQLLSNRTTGSVAVAGTFSPPPPIGGSALQLTADRPSSIGGPETSLPAYTPGRLTPRVERASIAPPPLVSRRPAPGSTQLRQELSPRNASPALVVPRAIAIPVPDPDSRSVRESSVQQPMIPPNFDSSSSVSSEGKLPVPGRNIPLGRGGYVPAILGGNSVAGLENSPSFNRAIALGFRYRVVVDAQSSGDRQKMVSLVPDAFRTFTNGRSVMQAGAFREREKAEELLQILTVNGLNARIEDIK
jgi:parallel beta-helix repeat protein